MGAKALAIKCEWKNEEASGMSHPSGLYVLPVKPQKPCETYNYDRKFKKEPTDKGSPGAWASGTCGEPRPGTFFQEGRWRIPEYTNHDRSRQSGLCGPNRPALRSQ